MTATAPAPGHSHSGEHGRVSIFLAVTMIGVLAIIGLSFDAAGQLRTLQRAQNLAAEAARAGGQAIDRATAIEGGPKRIDPEEAAVAVANYLAAVDIAGHTVGFPEVGGEVRIRVTVTITYQRSMLGPFVQDKTVAVTGEATASAITTAP
ncbi:pilus assembly protein TadG-related protein [Micromonospora sp. WMMD961]|uniref:pilus assembly protein TadG-related protein n=1 Tax=Micromonospora sp. WMMD961 TaxID=3016100 RepID=UPI002417E752|nr:pilus assembly protein TadG-related protein [Micromonospora sp. WMMD961]MDG4778532.1 pilus assembly protein TadG-related protein [Micromonospora sp. WMMD961]